MCEMDQTSRLLRRFFLKATFSILLIRYFHKKAVIFYDKAETGSDS